MKARNKQAHFTCEGCGTKIVRVVPPMPRMSVFIVGPCEECGYDGWKKGGKLCDEPYPASVLGPDVDDPTLVELVRLCQFVLNQIPRTPLRHDAFLDSYQVAAYLDKHCPE